MRMPFIIMIITVYFRDNKCILSCKVRHKLCFAMSILCANPAEAAANMGIMNSSSTVDTLAPVQIACTVADNAVEFATADGKPFKISTGYLNATFYVNETDPLRTSVIMSLPYAEFTDPENVAGPLTHNAAVFTQVAKIVGFAGEMYTVAADNLVAMVSKAGKLAARNNFKDLLPDAKGKKGKAGTAAAAFKADAKAASVGGRPERVNAQVFKFYHNTNEDSPHYNEKFVQLNMKITLASAAPAGGAAASLPDGLMAALHPESHIRGYLGANPDAVVKTLRLYAHTRDQRIEPVQYWDLLGGGHLAPDTPYASSKANSHKVVAKFNLSFNKLTLLGCADKQGRLVLGSFVDSATVLCRVQNSESAGAPAVTEAEQTLLTQCTFQASKRPADTLDAPAAKRPAVVDEIEGSV